MAPLWRAQASPVIGAAAPALAVAVVAVTAAARSRADSLRNSCDDHARTRPGDYRVRLDRPSGALSRTRDAALRAVRETAVRSLRRHQARRREVQCILQQAGRRGYA